MSQPEVICISGGIGAGKSVVSRILRTKGYAVYDCDLEARRLMDNDPDLHQRLRKEIGPQAVSSDGILDRGYISGIVFSDPDKLRRLNEMVHTLVKNDIESWISRGQQEEEKLLFIETAIPVSSGVEYLCHRIWQVTAPVGLRVARAVSRSGLTEEEVLKRIAAQVAEEAYSSDVSVSEIKNDGQSLLSQIDLLIENIAKKK